MCHYKREQKKQKKTKETKEQRKKTKTNGVSCYYLFWKKLLKFQA